MVGVLSEGRSDSSTDHPKVVMDFPLTGTNDRSVHPQVKDLVDSFRVEGLLINPNQVGSLQLPISRSALLPSIGKELVSEKEDRFCAKIVSEEETTLASSSVSTALPVEDTFVEEVAKVEGSEDANLLV